MARGKTVDVYGNPEMEDEGQDLGNLGEPQAPEPGDGLLSQIDPTQIPTETDWPVPEVDVRRKDPTPQPARSAEGPRENAVDRIQATRRRPAEPSPMSGSFFTAGGGREAPMGGVRPFTPMGDTNGTDLASPMGGDVGVTRRSPVALFGSLGGLQGGGLGVPLDPMSNATSDPISSLIESLLKGKGQV